MVIYKRIQTDSSIASFQMWYDSFKIFIKKWGETFKLQKEILKTEMNHDEVYSDTWRDKKSEWLDYVKNDVLCTAFSYARFTEAMEEITGFGKKNCLSSPGFG